MPIAPVRVVILLLLAIAVFAADPQTTVAIPSWAIPYPGATVETRTSRPTLVDTLYNTSAKPTEVLEHYGKLFEGAGLPFQPNFDGIGTTVRAAVTGCDLLVRIRPDGTGSQVRVSCAAKTGSSPYGSMITGVQQPPKQAEETPVAAKPVETQEPKEPRAKKQSSANVDERGEPKGKPRLPPI